MIVHCLLGAFAAFNSAATPSTACEDVHNCRTASAIIYNCLSTIFLCTWVALHPDIPKNPQRQLLIRIGLVLSALLAPETILVWAFTNWMGSCGGLVKLLEKYPACGWTETHAIFAHMGGFRLVSQDGSERTSLYADEFFDRALKGEIKIPTITETEIRDKSKGDGIAKAIAIIQTLWFGLQAAHRVNQGLVVTELEVTTLAHVVLNIFIYWFWWNKPLNVQCPVDVYPQLETPSSEDKARSGTEGAQGTESKMPPQLEAQAPSSEDKARSGTEGAQGTESKMPPQLEAQAPSSEDKARSGTEGAQGTESKMPLQLEAQAPSSEDIERSGSEGAQGTGSQMPPPPPLSFRVRLARYFIGDVPSTSSSFGDLMFVTLFILCLVPTPALFGAIHCLAWNSVFPTHKEQTIWRASTIVAIVLPCLIFGLLLAMDNMKGTAENFLIAVNFLLALAYTAARICLLVVAFGTLRALPYKALETPSWSSYIPHIG